MQHTPVLPFLAFGVRQSTASFVQRHFFDDFEVKAYLPDVTPPSVVSLTATSANTLELLFDEITETASSTNVFNYSVNNGVGNPASAVPDPANQQKMI